MLQNLAKMRKNRWSENEEIGEARKTTTKKSSLSNGPAPSTNVSGNFGPPTVLVKMPNTNNENLRQISNHCSIGAEPNCSKGMMQVNGGSASKRKENAKIASGPMVQSFGGGECKFSMNANQQPELEISENEPQHSNTPTTKPNRIGSNFEMNNSSGSTLAGFQQHSHSPATSPGASSTQSQRSFHFHLSTSTLANLRKSGVNLVKNIPGNIRRSSLAMFQMRAMGTVDSVKGCGGDMVDFPGTTSAGKDRRQNHRPSADSSTEMQSADTMSLHRQHLAQWAAKSSSSNSCSSTGGGVGSSAGTIAKRAMRKRISAAKTVLRKISRISTQSASGCSSISNVGTSSSVAGICARVASTSSGYCSPKRTMTATIPCCSCPNCSRAEMAAAHAECSLVHSAECRKCSNRLLEVDWQRKMEDGQRQKHPEEPKKKRSWTATFVKNKKGKSGKSRKGPTLGGEEDGEAEAVAAAENAIARFGSGCGGKKPLGPSLSWDPQQQQWLLRQQRSRTSSAASQTSRSRIHSDGSAKQRFPLRDSNSGYWPSASFSLNAQKCPSQTHSIGEQAEKEKGRHQFEKHSKKGASAAAGKRRKKSSSALALCKGGGGRGNGSKKSGAGTLSQSQSLSTLGGLEFGPDQEKALGRSALESSCLHCALLAEYRTTNLRAEIECAVKRLAARLSNGGSPARARRTIALGEQKLEKEKKMLAQQQRKEAVEQRQMMEMIRRQMGTPDIVVSSCNSEDTPESADEGFWTNPSPSHPPTNNSHHHQHHHQQLPPNSATIPVMPSPIALSPSSNPFDGQNDGLQDASSLIPQLKAQSMPPMDTLKPPGFPFGLPCSSTSSSQSPSSLYSPLTAPFDSIGSGGLSSPPRSNSVDLSQLRRDIELWSVSSLSDVEGCSAQAGAEGRPGTAGISTPGGDSIRTVRSRSYDPSSSPEHMLRRPSRIEHLSEIFRKALAKSPVVKRAAAAQEHEHKRVPKHRTSRYWLEEQLTPSEHIWLPSSSTSSSSATTVDTECYLGEKDCEKLGEKRRCAACHIVAHTACFPLLAKMNLSCKYTFRDCASTSASSRRQNAVAKDGNGDPLQKHHWVHRWRLEGRCFHCGKSFQQKMFREKEVIAITCSWCKRSYHNKRSCFSLARFDDHCDRGLLREMILPPGWLLRLGHQRRHRHQQQAQQTAAQLLKKSKRKYRPFVVKQLDQPVQHHQQIQQNGPSSDSASHQLAQPNGRLSCCGPSIQPLLVFVNPKSGGNKGAKALNSLCWLLNPRQVFDINAMRGPKFGLEMFRKVASHMRILVCGGDGTVGWVLSTLDLLNWALYPPIALLPLGTGNDLSRSMGWGGTFSDEPLSEMLQAIQTETSVTHLDRWRLDVFPLPSTEPSNSNGGQQMGNNETNTGAAGTAQEDQQPSTPTCLAGNAAADASSFQTTLPLSVMNNYFSIGADAHVALQFHHSRSANPQMLNSRLKNRIAYGGLGTIDLFKRTWKDLTEFITVECDGVDITPKLRELKFHCILFHNIAFYAGGTVPWGAGGDGVQESCGEVFSRPSPCDGKIEVLGFTTATLATLQMGGKGERIAQCSKVRIETSKPIPMQVDGEPTLLGPSLILLSFHNKVPMLRREKFARMSGSAPANNIISMNANRRKSSNNSSSGGGSQSVIVVGGNAATTTISPCGQISPMVTMPTPPQHQHKCSRASLCADSIVQRPVASSPPNSVFLCVPIVVVGRHDYDTYRDSVDRLKDTGFELGTLNVEAEMELGQLRQQIQQMLMHHQILPYEPGRDWRFLDYVSNSEEGAFRISRQQEHCRTVADVCTLDDGAGILILDDAFPSMTVRSAAIGHELVFCPPGTGKPMSALEQNLLMRRRISETLRIVLSSESQETHL